VIAAVTLMTVAIITPIFTAWADGIDHPVVRIVVIITTETTGPGSPARVRYFRSRTPPILSKLNSRDKPIRCGEYAR